MNIQEIIKKIGWSMPKFANYFGIPVRTVQNWCYRGGCPDYVTNLIIYKLKTEGIIMKISVYLYKTNANNGLVMVSSDGRWIDLAIDSHGRDVNSGIDIYAADAINQLKIWYAENEQNSFDDNYQTWATSDKMAFGENFKIEFDADKLIKIFEYVE